VFDLAADNDRQRQTPPDRRLAELAARQYGVVTIGQLRLLGVRDGAIARRLAAGRLHVVHRGVYAVGHAEISREGRFLAAVLAVGDRAVLSHRSAGAHWAFVEAGGEGEIEVTAPTSRR
jgi:predicted transcriptional regulator of viral defense system